MFSEYHEAVRYLQSLVQLPKKHEYMKDRVDPSVYLKRMDYFLGLLGHPEIGPKYVHITGTSGKGTVSTIIHDMLKRSGYTVGLVTSPFVTTTIEKTKVNDLFISPEDFVRIVNDIKPHIDDAYLNGPYDRPSYFEILLAISYIYFKEQKCDWVVLEVGCGGRYDYTNTIKHSEISLITNIDNDHLHLIGPTLADVAYEKVGIVKEGSVLFTTEENEEYLDIFKKECKAKKAEFNKVEAVTDKHITNHNLVRAAGERLGISDSVTKEAIDSFRMQGRNEVVSENPEIILDGAHNEAKMNAFVSKLDKVKKYNIVFGAGKTKNVERMLDILIPYVNKFYFTRSMVAPSEVHSPREMFTYTESKGVPSKIFLDPFQAIESAKEGGLPIVVTGSFFLVGEIRSLWYSEEYILTNRKAF